MSKRILMMNLVVLSMALFGCPSNDVSVEVDALNIPSDAATLKYEVWVNNRQAKTYVINNLQSMLTAGQKTYTILFDLGNQSTGSAMFSLGVFDQSDNLLNAKTIPLILGASASNPTLQFDLKSSNFLKEAISTLKSKGAIIPDCKEPIIYFVTDGISEDINSISLTFEGWGFYTNSTVDLVLDYRNNSMNGTPPMSCTAQPASGFCEETKSAKMISSTEFKIDSKLFVAAALIGGSVTITNPSSQSCTFRWGTRVP